MYVARATSDKKRIFHKKSLKINYGAQFECFKKYFECIIFNIVEDSKYDPNMDMNINESDNF